MDCTFVVGQKVVYVGEDSDQALERNGVYTITEVMLGVNWWTGEIGIALKLKEFVPPEGWGDGGFDHRQFRPVVDLLADFLAKRKLTEHV